MEEMQRARCRERARSFHALLERTTFSITPLVHQREAFLTLSFWVFMEASLHSYDWLHHWPGVTDSTFSPSPCPGGLRGGTKSSTLLITWLSPRETAPILRCGPKVTSITEQKTPLSLSSLGKFQRFQEFCDRNYTKIVYIFLIINHNIVHSCILTE